MAAGDSLRRRPEREAGGSRAALEAFGDLSWSAAVPLLRRESSFQAAKAFRSEILWRTARLYSHTPRPFWRALACCIAIGSRGSAEPSLVQKVLKFEPMAVQLHCAIEKGFSSGKKETFPHTQYE
ncbi:hypothetical protein DPX16_14679 [Anabarilius grahami]|uniref:Uncharacterized protein n=1 Tax=Anabarilius grahami TaxID=495550 RepID=A0A3N0XNX8_ANAGA|nr:hypothetical protein DPX16_14679 [Anabarilius grahami]